MNWNLEFGIWNQQTLQSGTQLGRGRGGARGASKGKKVLPKKHSLTLGYNEKKNSSIFVSIYLFVFRFSNEIYKFV